jgi:hypothetical protein
METSILNSTKKILGLSEDYTVFDHDVITHINSAFTSLAQLGVGPATGFMISGPDEEWSDFIDPAMDMLFNSVQTYLFLKVRSYFDPPATSYMISSMERQIQELEWRLNIERESTDWVDPDPEEEIVYE